MRFVDCYSYSRERRWSKFKWMGTGSDRMLQNTNVPGTVSE
jgi:hypothetical protein